MVAVLLAILITAGELYHSEMQVRRALPELNGALGKIQHSLLIEWNGATEFAWMQGVMYQPVLWGQMWRPQPCLISRAA